MKKEHEHDGTPSIKEVLINSILRYLANYPLPITETGKWLVMDNSEMEPKIRLYEGLGLDVVSDLYFSNRLIPWNHKDSAKPYHFIGADGNTVIKPLTEGDAFDYAGKVQFSDGQLVVADTFFQPIHSNLLECINTKEGFLKQAMFAGIRISEEAFCMLFDEEPPIDPVLFLTGEQIAERLEMERYDYDGFGIENIEYLHPEKLFTSTELTNVPSTLQPAMEPYRSGDVWKSPEGHYYLYLGVLKEPEIEENKYVAYLLGSDKEGVGYGGTAIFNHEEVKAHLKIKFNYVPYKYR
jgi:hypothetical protein